MGIQWFTATETRIPILLIIFAFVAVIVWTIFDEVNKRKKEYKSRKFTVLVRPLEHLIIETNVPFSMYATTWYSFTIRRVSELSELPLKKYWVSERIHPFKYSINKELNPKGDKYEDVWSIDDGYDAEITFSCKHGYINVKRYKKAVKS